MAMLAVAPEQQRQGIGRLLVDQAEALAHSKGCKGMNLHASSCRAPVLRFYEALGYAVVGTEQLPEQVSPRRGLRERAGRAYRQACREVRDALGR